jgi:hypothetical protein
MMVLAVSHNTGDPTPHLQAEAARMAELQQAGLVELMLLKADWSGAVLVLRAADLAAAREAVGSLPLVTHGITCRHTPPRSARDSVLRAGMHSANYATSADGIGQTRL